MHTKKELEEDLKKAGIGPGDVILMHSSFRSLGGIEGGAGGFFDVFLSLLGPEGTLLLPALSYDSVGEGQPDFYRLETKSCVGWLPEYFRTKVPGVVRSMHATHSVCAAGKYAEEMTGEHVLDLTPVGEHSPFRKLPQYGGRILILGSHPDHNTTMHGVEETVVPPYLFEDGKTVRYRLHDSDGSVIEQTAKHHWFGPGGEGYVQRYGRIIGLLDEKEYTRGRVLDAEIHLMDAAAVWKKGHAKLEEDPFWFVDRV